MIGSKNLLLFDQQDKNDYTPYAVDIKGPRVSIAEQIQKRNGITSDKIDSVFFRYDYTSSPSTTQSRLNTKKPRPLRPPQPHSSQISQSKIPPPNGTADSSTLSTQTAKWETLAGLWVRFGPFYKAIDVFGDQSFWVIQAPGHMPGNLCACTRVEDGRWVLLGSACCHSRELLDGTQDFGYV